MFALEVFFLSIPFIVGISIHSMLSLIINSVFALDVNSFVMLSLGVEEHRN